MVEAQVLPVQEKNFRRHNPRTPEIEYPIMYSIFFLNNLSCSHLATQITGRTQEIGSKVFPHRKARAFLHQHSSLSFQFSSFPSFSSSRVLKKDQPRCLALYALLSSEEILAKWEP